MRALTSNRGAELATRWLSLCVQRVLPSSEAAPGDRDYRIGREPSASRNARTVLLAGAVRRKTKLPVVAFLKLPDCFYPA